jgi:hypothetical protein
MSDNTIVIVEAIDSVKSITIDGPEPIGTVIVGSETNDVIIGAPDVVVIEPVAPTSPGTIVLAPGQFGTVVVGDDPVTVILSNPEYTIIPTGIPGVPGPPGPPGEGGASEADEVAYANPAYANVQDALDALLYLPPKINSFTNNIGTREKGSSVDSVTLTWAFNKVMTSVTLNGVDIDSGASSTTIEGPLTSDQSWTLQASDGKNTVSASTSISFAQKRYWGASALTTLDDENIIGLGSSEFSANFNKSASYDCTGGKYPYIAYPASFGTPSAVTVGGLAFSDLNIATQNFTNASGFVDSYKVVRFAGLQTGANISVVWG